MLNFGGVDGIHVPSKGFMSLLVVTDIMSRVDPNARMTKVHLDQAWPKSLDLANPRP